jgi:hypothetical protein
VNGERQDDIPLFPFLELALDFVKEFHRFLLPSAPRYTIPLNTAVVAPAGRSQVNEIPTPTLLMIPPNTVAPSIITAREVE